MAFRITITDGFIVETGTVAEAIEFVESLNLRNTGRMSARQKDNGPTAKRHHPRPLKRTPQTGNTTDRTSEKTDTYGEVAAKVLQALEAGPLTPRALYQQLGIDAALGRRVL